MIEIIWEYVVKEEAQDQFRLAYGPGGAWSKLFAQCPGFQGINVLRDMKNPRRYLMIEIWKTEALRELALAKHKAEFSELEIVLDGLIESKTKIGIFSMLTEATVRPIGTKRQSHKHSISNAPPYLLTNC